MSESSCPMEDDLLPLLTDDTLPSRIRAHLDGCPACVSRLDRLQAELTDLRSAPQPRPKTSENIRPSVIGKYLIVGALDAGGQALVYRAIHPTLDKELVIKLSRSPLEAGSVDRDLLVREGKLLATLDHPNLARVYDLDFHGDLPFLAMEYIRGLTLGKFAAEDPLTPQDSARLVGEVAQALALVHRRGIIHQDIKPKNILVDEESRARLIDFGMARLRHAWDGTEPFGGTPDYMAPELARGEENRVTVRSDVFSLGGVLYFLLTGSAPFAAPTPEKALQRARKCDFDRIALERFHSPRRLREVCLRAMSTEPESRYGNAEEFAKALDQASAPLVTRRQVLVVAGGFTAAALAILAGPMVNEWLRPTPFAPDFVAEVYRNGERLDLAKAKPLDPATDGLVFTGHVPRDFEAALFWRKADGSVERFPLKPVPGRGIATISFPEPPNAVSLKPGPEPQTDIVFLVAGKSLKQLDEFEPLLLGAMTKLRDKLLIRNFLVWDREHNEVRILSPDDSPRSVGREMQTQSPGAMRTEPALLFKEGIQALLAELQQKIPILLPMAFSY